MRHFERVEQLVSELRPGYPIYCFRPQVLEREARRFGRLFPGTVLYAVKSNPLPAVIQTLSRAGIGHFDTASLPEIALVNELVSGAHCYFMHPVKDRAAIRAAYRVYGVRHFVVDHVDELGKLQSEIGREEVIVVVRLATPGSGATFDLSTKFGATAREVQALMRRAARAGYRVGICFHVGSQCASEHTFVRALRSVGEVIAQAQVEPCCVDVGGGFPAPYLGERLPGLERFMDVIRDGVAGLGLPSTCQVMCEPGRALVAQSMSLVAQVQLRKGAALYINDGIYGSMIAATIGIRFPVRLVRPDAPSRADPMDFTVYGPTCDGLDTLPGTVSLPGDVREGDFLEFGLVGAYGNALRTDFNGFRPDTFVTIDTPFLAETKDQAGLQVTAGADERGDCGYL